MTSKKFKVFNPSVEEVSQMKEFAKTTDEQKLRWLDSWREFMFEVWRCNPELRKQYEEMQADGNKRV